MRVELTTLRNAKMKLLNNNMWSWFGAMLLVVLVFGGGIYLANLSISQMSPTQTKPQQIQLSNKKALTHSNAPSSPTLVHPNVPTTPVISTPQATSTMATQYHSAATVYGSPVHKTVSTPVKVNTVDQQTPAPAVSSPPAGNAGDKMPCPATGCDSGYSYDLWGNYYDPYGKLLHAACPNVPDPISHQDNPQCVCPAATDTYTWYLMGYDKDTNAAVCHIEYYHACPYSENVSADDPLCYKNNPQP